METVGWYVCFICGIWCSRDTHQHCSCRCPALWRKAAPGIIKRTLRWNRIGKSAACWMWRRFWFILRNRCTTGWGKLGPSPGHCRLSRKRCGKGMLPRKSAQSGNLSSSPMAAKRFPPRGWKKTSVMLLMPRSGALFSNLRILDCWLRSTMATGLNIVWIWIL